MGPMAFSLLALLLHAALPPAGQWRLTQQHTHVRVLSWGLFCGKEPKDSRGIPGAEFALTQVGDGFEIRGAGRRYGTATCGMDASVFRPRVSDRVDQRWQVECQGPPVAGAPQLTHHSFEVSDDTMVYVTRGEVRKHDTPDACRYTYQTTMNFALATAAGPCATPGAAVSLVLSPASKDMHPGDRVCLQAAAMDAHGCAVPAGAVRFAAEPEGAVTLDGSSCAWANDEVPETVLVAITATAGQAVGNAVLRVVAPDAAVESLEQTAARSTSARVRALVGEVLAGEVVVKPPNEVMADEHAAAQQPLPTPPPRARGVPAWVLLGGGAGILLLVGALALWLRGRKRVVEVPLPTLPPPLAGQGYQCPVCRFEYAQPGRCVHDNAVLIRNQAAGRATMFIPEIGGMICPTCGQRYPKRARFCGNDRSPLIPDVGDGAPPPDAA